MKQHSFHSGPLQPLYFYHLDRPVLGVGIADRVGRAAIFSVIIDGDHPAGLVHHIAVAYVVAVVRGFFAQHLDPITEENHLLKECVSAVQSAPIWQRLLQYQRMALRFQFYDEGGKNQIRALIVGVWFPGSKVHEHGEMSQPRCRIQIILCLQKRQRIGFDSFGFTIVKYPGEFFCYQAISHSLVQALLE